MTYTRRHYPHEDDAHAAAIVLETFGHDAGVIETKVLGALDGTEATEYEVWCVCRDHSPRIEPPEPDEHDMGRATLYDEDHEARDY